MDSLYLEHPLSRTSLYLEQFSRSLSIDSSLIFSISNKLFGPLRVRDRESPLHSDHNHPKRLLFQRQLGFPLVFSAFLNFSSLFKDFQTSFQIQGVSRFPRRWPLCMDGPPCMTISIK